MKSVAFDHFPRVAAGSNRFWLFNPILKKRYENRPEERVRLKWVDYILHQTDWKKSRIGFETPVNIPQEKNTLRADLVLYSKDMKPEVLIECKSDSVKLNQSTAEQAARYNSNVKARYLVLTNGIEDFWFEKTGNNIRPAENFFNESAFFQNRERDFKYWQQRGFCSESSESKLNGWITDVLNTLWTEEIKGTRHYLNFQKTVLLVPMNHYYKVFDINAKKRLAITFIGTHSSHNFLVGILNSNGNNAGIFSLNLDKLRRNEQACLSVFQGGQEKRITPKKEFSFLFDDVNVEEVNNLHQTIMNFFD